MNLISDGLNPESKWQRAIDNYIWPGTKQVQEKSKLRSGLHLIWHTISLVYAKLRCRKGKFDKSRIKHHYKILRR
ncbi:hypothetical protein pb186bvf_015771 [Paramecium bursaria]